MTKSEAVHSVAMIAAVLRRVGFDPDGGEPEIAASRRLVAIEEATELLALANGEVTALWMFDRE